MGVAVGREVAVRVPGKINLGLRSGPRRADGYHCLTTVFQAVSVYDEVTVRPAAPGRIDIRVTGAAAAAVPTGPGNLAHQAALELSRAFPSEGGLASGVGVGRGAAGEPTAGSASTLADSGRGAEIVIHKGIPVAGGMAGGSADAAAALLGLSLLWGIDASGEQLARIAAKVGADVPFALRGETALGVNRGDVLTPALDRTTCHWLLVFSDEGLSTPAVFAKLDELRPNAAEPEVDDDLLAALASGDSRRLGAALNNDLQAAAIAMRPELGEILRFGVESGAYGGVVSGSGPTVALLCASVGAAQELAARLSGEGLGHSTLCVTGPVCGASVVE
ncbi:MAG: 4-(cytidine 5'-diphospho)-2-C-methyl-D-erythritol kinase [Propionibacteriaceae bacterium]|jgi:4-diphosphocytidyl-2-C-methyl-D-erythritol kinase|nr:4-(cytidine 5'-diphospho)-2-C-methyl-D-erythritol kinase [Propionibacteriaceae bacterium]